MSETAHQAKHPREHLNQLEAWLDLYLVKKGPALPPTWKETLVKIAPWVVIVGAVLAVPAILGLIGLSALVTANPYGAVAASAFGATYYVSIILLIVTVVLELMALPGLFARRRKGWDFVFYAALVSALSSLISLNIASFIIGTILSLYLLFQVREYYK